MSLNIPEWKKRVEQTAQADEAARSRVRCWLKHAGEGWQDRGYLPVGLGAESSRDPSQETRMKSERARRGPAAGGPSREADPRAAGGGDRGAETGVVGDEEHSM